MSTPAHHLTHSHAQQETANKTTTFCLYTQAHAAEDDSRNLSATV